MPKKNTSTGIKSKTLKDLYSKPLPSSRSGPIYNAFSYPTKISPEAIAVFIATHTKPNAKILDIFGGSGTTGLAALLCDKPTSEMQKIAADLNVTPEWGPRIAEIYELSTLGAFSAGILTSPPDITNFEQSAKQLLILAKEKIGWIYQAQDKNENIGQIRYTIWSDILICPNCNTEISYYNASVRWKPLRIDESFVCKNCKIKVPIERCARATELIKDPILKIKILQKKRIPIKIYGTSVSGNWSREFTDVDQSIYNQAAKIDIPISAPRHKIHFGDLYRSGYHQGITHLHHFYTARNFLAVATLWDLISEFPKKIQDPLRLLVLSYNATHSTLMSRVVIKKEQNDFVITGSQSGVLYISGLPVEKNVFLGIKRKIGSFTRAFEAVKSSRSRVKVVNSSSTKLNLPTASVDYVFTDPPFGDYIPYSEVNQINEIWLGKATNSTEEIIISQAQSKSVHDYGKLLEKVFKEVSRVLKPSGLVTVVFHSAHPEVRHALSKAFDVANLFIRNTSVLNKLQSSFKQVVSTVFVQGDSLILLSKRKKTMRINKRTEESIAQEILQEAISKNSSKINSSLLYSKFVSRCLELGIRINISAQDFHSHLIIIKKQNE